MTDNYTESVPFHKEEPILPPEKPILFSGPMVRAILEGRKTQTRRIIKPGRGLWESDGGELRPIPQGKPGTRLWVRERCRAVESEDGSDRVEYEADGAQIEIANTDEAARNWLDLAHYRNPGRDAKKRGLWVNSIHMPRWASRITLKVKAIKVERLKDISEEDAKAEGLWSYDMDDCDGDPRLDGRLCRETYWHWHKDIEEGDGYSGPIMAYRCLWESINGPKSWDLNPWVTATTFERIA